MTRGLPVPSHWLHFGRVLRGSIRLQEPSTHLVSVGAELGYPDGFAFSNQMKRLTGLRPSIMREAFGWEWIVESWLHQEAASGGLSQALAEKLFPDWRQDSSGGEGRASNDDSEGTLKVAESRRGPG